MQKQSHFYQLFSIAVSGAFWFDQYPFVIHHFFKCNNMNQWGFHLLYVLK